MGTHVKKDPAGWEFKRQRDGRKHINNCGTGKPDGGYRKLKMHQVHHALCVYACSDATMKQEDVDFIRLCLAETDWDINAAENVIGLPLKKAYVRDSKNVLWDGYPCHQVDHDIYLTDVENHVKTKIWDKVRKTKKAKKCEQLKGDKLAKKFLDASRLWKDFLNDRGIENGGTKACLEYCVNPPPKGTKTKMNDSNWYVPFSMAKALSAIRPRAKPPSNKILQRIGLLIELIC